MTTHTNDCADCDFRLGVVPRRKNRDGTRAVAPARFAYPRYIGDDRGTTFTADYVTDKQYPWEATKPAGFIPEVESTLSYVDGSYPLINEHQVALGESTCSARLVNIPIFDGGKALFDISDLARVALERARTAREAIRIMGQLGEQYGYYGAEWKGPDAYGEAGESLTVADGKEVWIFHMLPDDTGAGAVWAAQRVPDGHVAVVANEFIIKEIDLDDPENFMASANVHEVAIRNKFWDPKSGKPFNFRKSYMYSAFHVHQEYADRRNWRVLSMVAPSRHFTSNMTLDDLPFSVKPDKKLTVHEVFRINRDHYEGTAFDLTKGLAAGPFGNPNRYDPSYMSGAPINLLLAGNFERAISIHRTAYSTVTQSRAWLPDPVGGKVWFGNSQPHATCYIPVYGAATEVAKELTRGSLYKWDPQSAWWAFSAVGNWMERAYMWISQDVRFAQYEQETQLLKEAAAIESEAAKVFESDPAKAVEMVTKYGVDAGSRVVKTWYDLFFLLVAKYKDGARIDDFHSERFEPTPLFYPFTWLYHAGYWAHSDIKPDPAIVPRSAVETVPLAAEDAAAASSSSTASTSAGFSVGFAAVSVLALSAVFGLGVVVGKKSAKGNKMEYSDI